jgi:SAM-dependent methyltransferase
MMTASCACPPMPVCPLSGTPMALWLHVPCDWRRPGAVAGYDLFWSRQARFGQLHPRPSKEEIASFYDVEYYTHDDPSSAASRPQKTFVERLRGHLAWRADYGTDITAERLTSLATSDSPSVLDVGCGNGQLLAELREAGWAAVGVEPDPIARKGAVDRGLEVYGGTAEELPWELQHRTFDLIVFNHVLEHCLDPVQALRVAAAQLKPNGAVVAETPNNEAVGCRVAGPAWPWLDVPRHLNFFTAHSLAFACQAAGLAPVSTEYTGYTRQFQRPWLEMEQHIRTSFSPQDSAPRRCSDLRGWGLLLRTAFSRSRYKYDSVRVVARNGAADRRCSTEAARGARTPAFGGARCSAGS